MYWCFLSRAAGCGEWPPWSPPMPLRIREEIHLLFSDRITKTTHATTFWLALTYEDTTYPPETYKPLRSLLFTQKPLWKVKQSDTNTFRWVSVKLLIQRFGSESWKVNHSGRRVMEHEVKTTNTPARWSPSPRTHHLWERHRHRSAGINPKMFPKQILLLNTSITIYLCQ